MSTKPHDGPRGALRVVVLHGAETRTFSDVRTMPRQNFMALQLGIAVTNTGNKTLGDTCFSGCLGGESGDLCDMGFKRKKGNFSSPDL